MLNANTSAAVHIGPPTTAREWREVRALILDHLTWIRSATGIDVFEQQADAYTELDQLECWYVPPRGRMLLARLHGVAVGTLGVLVEEPGVGELRRLYVRPGARGHRLGERLVERAIQAGTSLGCLSLRLETVKGAMDSAIAIYERLGFERASFDGIHDHPDVLRLSRALTRTAAAA